MAYARPDRKGDSDLYAIESANGFDCLASWCRQGGCKTHSRLEFLNHLEMHMLNGDKVPQHAIEEVLHEIELFGDTNPTPDDYGGW